QEYSTLVTAVIAYGVANLGHQLSRDGFFMPEGIYADFSTNKGRISVLLDHRNAPMTVANFIGLAEGSISNKTYPEWKPFFNGSIWHRVVKGHVIQAGEPAVVKDPANQEESSTGYEIPNEISSLRHSKAGMIGMANAGPHTNTCQFYITLADRSYLDGNYTLFGEVVDGMDVVNKIGQGDTIFSVTIARAGTEAEKFIVNDDTFTRMVENQWRKVKRERQEKADFESKFISDNYPGLTSTESGLRYKVLKDGTGPAPADSSFLSISYTGTLIGGDSFVSTSDGGKPDYGTKPEVFKWQAGRQGIIKGLQESLMSMKEGEKRLLVIPPALAYGEMSGFYGKSVPGKKRFVISPGQTLILELTLGRISSK
ncbi:MAG: peptidylprolyl isomerase, partial [Bacteroidales bacterium]|nr:peptidylprolyl isomerase [Bacteroidales bacterium]